MMTDRKDPRHFKTSYGKKGRQDSISEKERYNSIIVFSLATAPAAGCCYC